MQEIYCLVGEIVEASQVIEYNLALIIKYSEFIGKLKEKGRGKRSENVIAGFEREVDAMHKEISNFTLGQIINKVRDLGIFSTSSIDKLYKLLNFRNSLVHRFFKDNNFNQIERFGKRYGEIVQSLGEKLRSMQEINFKLCEIINGQQIEFSNLLKEI